MTDKFMKFKPPFKGTKFILIVPRTDIGNQLSGHPAAYIGIDELAVIPKADGTPVAYVGHRDGKPVIQLPADTPYQLVLRDDVDFVPSLKIAEDHMKYSNDLQELQDRLIKKPEQPPEQAWPGQYH